MTDRARRDPPTNDAIGFGLKIGDLVEVQTVDGCVTRGILRMRCDHTWLIANPSGQHFLWTGRIRRYSRPDPPACSI